jgi:hypothetical protein
MHRHWELISTSKRLCTKTNRSYNKKKNYLFNQRTRLKDHPEMKSTSSRYQSPWRKMWNRFHLHVPALVPVCFKCRKCIPSFIIYFPWFIQQISVITLYKNAKLYQFFFDVVITNKRDRIWEKETKERKTW